MGNRTTVTKAVFANALISVIVYLMETATGHDIPSTIEGSLSVLTLGVVLYILPENFPKKGSA